MEEDIEPSAGASMVPIALALLAIVLGGAGLYFGLNANQQIAPLTEFVDEGSSSSARIDKQLSTLATRLEELSAQNSQLKNSLQRQGLYGSQSEKLAKQAAAGVTANRAELVKLAESMLELAGSGARPATRTTAESTSDTNSSSNSSAALTATATPSGSASTYRIQAGDNFGKIASKKGVSLQALLDANPDADPRRLSIGHAINIPANQ